MRLVALAAAVLIAGCSTPYQESGLAGGVSATPLSQTIYEIRARGNGFTGSETNRDHALLKAAEVCLRNGFTHFIPLSDEQTTRKSFIANNTYSTCCFGYTCTTTGGGVTPVSKPSSDMTIQLLGYGYAIPPTAFSCPVIYNALAPKYLE